MVRNIFRISLALLAFTTTSTWAQSYTGPEDPRVKVEIVLQHPVNGVSTTPDGRMFLVYARVDGSSGPQVVEYFPETKTQRAFPNVAWNTLEAGDDFTQHFLGVNSQRVGPDGNLYIVDKGATGFGTPVKLPYGPKVVVVDLKTNKVSRVYLLGGVQRHDSLLGESMKSCPLSTASERSIALILPTFRFYSGSPGYKFECISCALKFLTHIHWSVYETL